MEEPKYSSMGDGIRDVLRRNGVSRVNSALVRVAWRELYPEAVCYTQSVKYRQRVVSVRFSTSIHRHAYQVRKVRALEGLRQHTGLGIRDLIFV